VVGVVLDGVGAVVEVVEVVDVVLDVVEVVGQDAVEVVLDEEVEVDEVLVGEHGLDVVDVLLDDVLLDVLVLLVPVRNETGAAAGLSPPPSPSSPDPSGTAVPSSDASAPA
jgi:hypothetical protein